MFIINFIDYVLQDPNGLIGDLVLALFALTVIASLVFAILTQVEKYRRRRVIQEISRIESYNDPRPY